MTSWRDIAFTLNEDDAAKVADAWSWLVPDWRRLVLCSMIGGMFVERSDGSVHWLESATALIEPVTPDAAAFDDLMRAQSSGMTEEVWEWFMPPLVERLHEAGKIPGPGECYGFTILPIFQESAGFEVSNMFALPALEWLTGSAVMHRQLREVPNGGQVEFKIVR